MKKIKLFMMLALLVMGVSNVWADTKTKDFYVNYEREFLNDQGGYSIDSRYSNAIKKFSDISGLKAVGDRMIRVTYDDYYGTITAATVAQYITANPIDGYTTRVVGIDNTIYICYIWSEAYDRVTEQYDYYGNLTYTINLKTNVLTQHEWPSGHFTYSDLYLKTDSRQVKNVIKLPANQCAVRLNTYTDTEITIPQKENNYDVVAIQGHGMGEYINPNFDWDGVPQNPNFEYEYLSACPGSNASGYAYNNYQNGSLVTVNFEKTSNVRSIGDYAFASCYTLENIEIPQSVEYLGEAAFSVCTGLKDGLTFERTSGASFTTNIKVIRNYTFWTCLKMTNLELPDGIIVIEGQQGGASMQYMTGLTHLRLPNTLVAVGPHFLCDASSLPEVTIPASVKYIDGACFHGCEKLRKVYLMGPASALQGVYEGSDTFDGNSTLCKDPVHDCVFITTQDNIKGYAEDTNGVWQKIADNRDSRCAQYLKAVKVDENGEVVRNNDHPVYEDNKYLTYASGSNVVAKACAQGSRHNALVYLPDQKVTFTPDKWVTVIFPKDFDDNALRTNFGGDYILAEMTEFQDPEKSWVNGKLTYHLNFTQVTTGAKKNIPYMIKPGHRIEGSSTPYEVIMIQANEMDENYRAEMSKDHALAITASDNTEVVMYGWYKKIDKMKLWEFYFKNPLNDKGQWNTNCQFKRVEDEAKAPAIKPFRCYWRIWLEGEARPDAVAGAKSGFFTFVDDETTAIEQPESNISIEIGNIYDINGRKLDINRKDLPKGLFIIDGKKVMVK